jgi:anti-sigma factor RsiW
LLLERYLAGDLSWAQRRRVEKQLNEDPALRAELASLRAQSEAFLAAAPPDQFAVRVAGLIDRSVRPRRRWVLWGFGSAGLVTASLAAVVLLRVQSESRNNSTFDHAAPVFAQPAMEPPARLQAPAGATPIPMRAQAHEPEIAAAQPRHSARRAPASKGTYAEPPPTSAARDLSPATEREALAAAPVAGSVTRAELAPEESRVAALEKGATAGAVVSLAVEVVVDGTRYRPGDVLRVGNRVGVTIHAPAAGYLAVVGEDDDGNLAPHFLGANAGARAVRMGAVAIRWSATSSVELVHIWFGSSPFFMSGTRPYPSANLETTTVQLGANR